MKYMILCFQITSSQEDLITFLNFLGSSLVSPQNFQKHQIAVHYKLCNTLRHTLVHAKGKTLRHKLDSVVYDIQCGQNVAQTKTYQQDATRELSPAYWSQITQGEKGEFVFFGNMSHPSK